MKRLLIFLCVAAVSTPASAFTGNASGVTDAQIRSFCPSFRSVPYRKQTSISPPGGGMGIVEIFVNQQGAQCSCVRDVRQTSATCREQRVR
ncbi:MAG: hypothetical protein ACRCTI_15755 [Beijerinckiaceae bacterium]